jgi:hypothetical protein
MKKINLVEMVSDFLASDMPGDMVSQYHPEIIKKYLENAFYQVVYQTWMTGKKFSDYSQLDAWTKTYRLQIFDHSLLDGLGLGNVRLPFPPVQLPNNMGIRQVSSYINESIVFAYLENTAIPIFQELEVSSIDTTPRFRLEQNDTLSGSETHILKLDKVPFGVMSPFYDIPPTVAYINVKMIVPLEEIGDYDDVAMPAGQEDLLVKQTIEFLKNKPPQDTINDQIADRPNQ